MHHGHFGPCALCTLQQSQPPAHCHTQPQRNNQPQYSLWKTNWNAWQALLTAAKSAPLRTRRPLWHVHRPCAQSPALGQDRWSAPQGTRFSRVRELQRTQPTRPLATPTSAMVITAAKDPENAPCTCFSNASTKPDTTALMMFAVRVVGLGGGASAAGKSAAVPYSIVCKVSIMNAL